ncbi:putative glycoside hydrolase [Chloroflexota bacterium]
MRSIVACLCALCLLLVSFGCQAPEAAPPPRLPAELANRHPAIASWLAKKDQLIASGKPYDLVMAGWFTPEEASQLKSNNPGAILLAGLTVNWVWDNADWKTFLLAVASYGRESPFSITEDMYLHSPGGERCAFGWASESWGHEEIYAMDPASPSWVELVTAFYKVVLEQPQHDGIIIDMVLEKSLCPEAISDAEWVEGTRHIMARISELNAEDKLVVLNSGRDLSEIDAYGEFMDGFLMENFMGEQLKTTFEDGLRAAESGYTVVYAVDTDDTGQQDMSKMRLGLVLSLLTDNTYFTYDFGPRDHGQAWWFGEYDVDLGQPLGAYYQQGDAYFREFERGIVVAAPNSDVTMTLDSPHTDVTSGEVDTEFLVQAGDGRIYIRAPSP